MNRLYKYINVVRRLSRHWTGKLGVVLIVTSTVTFFFFQILQFIGLFNNAYAGLLAYLLFPTIFLLGMLLVPVGWYYFKKEKGQTTRELLTESFDPDYLKARVIGSKALWIVSGISLASIVLLSSVSINALHFMDESEFCGTACHSVMSPEWIAYQQSPHARVQCVDCHIGEGVGAMVDAKLNGVWQMVSASFDLYSRPIPTPVHNLRPARETCEKCHWPEKFYGRKLKSIIHYDEDEFSTPKYTSLLLKIDAGHDAKPTGIHWHIASENDVRYASLSENRSEVIWVDVRQPDGNYKRFRNYKYNPDDVTEEHIRSLDCVDCHNRATHIYEEPARAIDDRIHAGLIDRSIPYIKKQGLKAILGSYPVKQDGIAAIDKSIRAFYNKHYPEFTQANPELISQSIDVLQAIYHRNIHPQMNITWGSYPNHIGHQEDSGCFRCHNQYLIDGNGENISSDCTLCHSILADGSDEIFQYLNNSIDHGRESLIQSYLQQEFLRTYTP